MQPEKTNRGHGMEKRIGIGILLVVAGGLILMSNPKHFFVLVNSRNKSCLFLNGLSDLFLSNQKKFRYEVEILPVYEKGKQDQNCRENHSD